MHMVRRHAVAEQPGVKETEVLLQKPQICKSVCVIKEDPSARVSVLCDMVGSVTTTRGKWDI